MKSASLIEESLRILLFSLSLAFPLSLTSEDRLPKEASVLLFEYEVLMAEVAKPIETLNGHYLKQLNKVEAQLQEAGNLDGVLMVREEMEAIKLTGMPAPNPSAPEPEELTRSREVYQRSRASLGERIWEEQKPIVSQHIQRLEVLVRRLTTEGRLDEALLVSELVEQAVEVASSKETTLAGKEGPTPGSGRLKVKVQVDGRTAFKIRGNQVWFDHSEGSFAKPGQHQGIFPTYLDDATEWEPEWDGDTTKPFEISWGLPTSDPMPKLNLLMSEGRGYAEVSEEAAKGNDFTTTVTLLDGKKEGGGFGGSDWMTFRIEWER
ncbi:MAG: hypothetical protein AAGC68_13450 [Verrucomicrobiota bacterium]